MDCDSKKEINVDENDMKELHEQLDKLETCEDVSREQSDKGSTDSIEEESCETDDFSEDFTNCPEEFETDETDSRHSYNEVASEQNIMLTGSISVNSLHQSQFLEEPTYSESPKIGKLQRKSTVFSSGLLSSQKTVSESSKTSPNVPEPSSLRQSQHIRSSLRTSMSLAASLQRGLDIIDYHQRSSATSNKSPVAFSFEHLTLKPSPEVFEKANASIETLPKDSRSVDGTPSMFLCPSCQRRRVDSDEVEESLKNWIVPVERMENDLSEDKKRAQELERICKEQAAKIEQLNHLVIVRFSAFYLVPVLCAICI